MQTNKSEFNEANARSVAIAEGNDLSQSALLALRLAALREVQKAKQFVRDFFFLPHAASSSAEVANSLDAAIEETAFAAMLAIAGSDFMNPRLAMYETPPYRILGTDIPGSRYGFDNPDRVFRHFFVNPALTYEIRGRRAVGEAGSTNMLLEACEDKPPGWGYPLTFLRLQDMAIESDGSFVVTVDSAPTANRRNHLWLPPGAAHVLIRDTYLDWELQRPTELSVRRTGGRTDVPPTPFEVLARQAGPKVIEHALNTFRFYDWGVAPVRANTIPIPLVRPAPPGEAPWGMTGVGRFSLAEDEAMMFTVHPVSAQYFGVIVATTWLVGRDSVKRTGSLNNHQSAPNADGSFTFVIAPRDPEVQNWLDTDGLYEGFMLLRWEMLQRTPDPNQAVRDVKIVKVEDARKAMPQPLPAYTAAQRQQQTAGRVAAHEQRLTALIPSRTTHET